VAGFAVCGLFEVARCFGIALYFRHLGEKEVAAVGLGFSREGVHQVLMGLGCFQIGHGVLLGSRVTIILQMTNVGPLSTWKMNAPKEIFNVLFTF
jgi:hypothetical protein